MRILPSLLLAGAVLTSAGCAASRSPHGQLSTLSVATHPDAAFCEHRVPQEACTRCNPHLVERFQAANDWCGPHGVPESQCFLCHPDLSFEPLPALAPGADLRQLSARGEDVPELASQAVPGKVTVFDFYADWCPPCRQVDAHMYRVLNQRPDVAYRKLNIVSWESPLARRHLHGVPSLPHLVVYGKDGRPVRAITGLNLSALDAAISEGAAR
jgi:thiol-disulfide isomerase/thioredoxin